ncbi:MAG: DUF3089 domain-containing protein [Polyangiales bacterium]
MRHLIHAAVIGLVVQGCVGDDAVDAPEAEVSAQTTTLDAGLVKVDRSGLTDVGKTGPLDYADPATWVCRPDMDPNECHANLDATEVLKDGGLNVIKHERAAAPAFDCFYVYPTVDLSGRGNMVDFSETGVRMVRDALLGQGARFSRVCEVFAPLYRQVSLGTLPDGGTSTAGSDPALAVGDVRAAFDYYLKNLNKGRPFVLIGHSQGTSMLTSLIQSTVDVDPELRKRFISGVLLGGGLSTEEGKITGGSFQNVPTCTKAGETGCVIAYVSYAKEAPPPENARFGRATKSADGKNLQVACTAPGPLAGNDGRYRGSYFSVSSNNPTFQTTDLPKVSTPYLLYRDLFRGRCVNEGGFSYHELVVDPTDDDTRKVPGYRNLRLEGAGWGLHLVDYNPAVDDLIDAVSQQAATLKSR